MIRRSTAIVLIVFIVLVFAAWYLQRERNTEAVDEITTSTPAISLFDFTLESLSKVQIEKAQNGRIIMEKDSQGIWLFIEPAGDEIDQVEAQSIAEKILGLNVLSNLDKSPALDVLGLDKPSYRIILTSDAGEEQEAIIGNLTPTSSGYYVSRLGQIPVIISKINLDTIIDAIENPPIYVTPIPTLTPLIFETQSPQNTPTP